MIENIGFGSSTLTSVGNLKKILNILDFTYDLGIRHYDTAPLYGKGYSEIILGKFIKDKRENVTITSKFGLGDNSKSKSLMLTPLLIANRLKKSIIKHKYQTTNNNDHILIKERLIDKTDIEKSFFKSIKSLNTTYLDYYFLHEGLPTFLTEEAVIYLESLKKNGDVLKLGLANNIHSIINTELTHLDIWDVFQYEGNNYNFKMEMMKKYPNKLHFHHSCLKGVNSFTFKPAEIPQLLLRAVKENEKGKVIFSSRSVERIKYNLQMLIV